MKNLFVSFLFLGAVPLAASSEIDARYSLRSVFAVVLNADPDNVHAQYVQSEVDRFFASRARFEPVARAPEILRATPGWQAPLDLALAKPEDIALLATEAKVSGADSLILLQVQRDGEQSSIVVLAALPEPTEILYLKKTVVNDRFSLASFGSATVEALQGFLQSLPFDAAVISREGYRVVIDRGAPSFQQGTRIAAYTLEPGSESVGIKQTGVILVQRVDRNLSFGTILVENKPLEVLKGNKVRYQSLGKFDATEPLANAPTPSREVASRPAPSLIESATPGREPFASVDVGLLASSLTWNRTAAGSGAFNSDSGFYPGAVIRGEVKLTQAFYAEAEGAFAFSSLSTQATGTSTGLSSQFSQLRLQGAYRVFLNRDGTGPGFSLRAGLSRTNYQVDDLPSVLSSSSASFTGLVVGGGISFPFADTIVGGLEMNALLFPSLTEGDSTSGASSNEVTGFDFSLKGSYRFSPELRLEARLVFQSHSAAFSGVGTRAVPLASLTQTSRSLVAGVHYTF
jgi:hypothetical protein